MVEDLEVAAEAVAMEVVATAEDVEVNFRRCIK